VDVAADLRAPVLGLYGGADQGIPPDTIEKMKAAAKLAHVPVEFVVYPDAPHAFHADYRPSYREGPARDGWARALAWLKAHGAA
jgi:carboxymethylenebutenolidase